MPKQIQRSRSKLPEEEVIPGCLWGLFHSDIHHRLRLGKILGERSAHGRRARGTKVPKLKMDVPSAAGGRDLTEADVNASSQVEERIDSAGKTSDKAQMRALIAQEISKQENKHTQQGQKRKITPFATRLLRTISIHHMQCNDYVHPNEMPDDRQIQEAPVLPHNSDSSSSNEHMPPLPKAPDEVNKGKRCEVCGTPSGPSSYVGHKKIDALGYLLLEKQAPLREKLREASKSSLKQQMGDKELQDVALHRSKDLLEALELLNANKELFVKILQEQGAMANYFQNEGDFRSEILLSKSCSFPGPGFSARRDGCSKLQDETVSLKKPVAKCGNENSQSLANLDFPKDDEAQVTVNSLRPSPSVRGIYVTASNSQSSTSLTHVAKSQRDSGRAVHRFKDIKRRIKEIIKENRKESHRISMDSVLHKIPFGSKASQGKNGDKSSLLEGPESDRCVGDIPRNCFGIDGTGSTKRNTIRHMRRSHSLTESLERYTFLLESSFSREPERQTSGKLRMVHEDNGQVTKPQRTFQRIFSLPEFDSYSLGRDDQIDISRGFLHSRSTSVDFPQGNATTDMSAVDEQTLLDRLDHGGPDRRLLDYETNAASDVLTAESMVSAPSNEQATASYTEVSDAPEEPSLAAVTGSYMADDPANPAEFSIVQVAAGAELKSDQNHFGDHDPTDSPQSQNDFYDSNIMARAGSDSSETQIPGMQLDLGALHFQVDGKYKVEFHYVRDVLKTYLFSGNELSERCCSPDKQLNSLVSEEVQGSTPELESYRYSDIHLDHELLYDLTNEVLLEICESSYAHCPWLSSVGAHVRPIPVGHHLLEEVWANISWHLKSQPQANPTLEHILDRDFKRNDGWMNLNYDIEYIGLDLEALVLDDLLDEVVIEFMDSAINVLSPS